MSEWLWWYCKSSQLSKIKQRADADSLRHWKLEAKVISKRYCWDMSYFPATEYKDCWHQVTEPNNWFPAFCNTNTLTNKNVTTHSKIREELSSLTLKDPTANLNIVLFYLTSTQKLVPYCSLCKAHGTVCVSSSSPRLCCHLAAEWPGRPCRWRCSWSPDPSSHREADTETWPWWASQVSRLCRLCTQSWHSETDSITIIGRLSVVGDSTDTYWISRPHSTEYDRNIILKVHQ